MRLPDITRKKVRLRVQYLSLIGHMARIDGKFDEREVDLLKRMAIRFKLSEKNKNLIFTKLVISEQQIDETFQELKTNKLHYSFILDLIAMAMADGVILEQERCNLIYLTK